jgi:hypothetical protein
MPPIDEENCAVLQGPELGSQECPQEESRRPLDLVLEKPSSDFELGVPYLMLTKCDAESFWLIFQLRNTSGAPACFVKVHDVTLEDPSGVEIVPPEDAYVDGRLRLLSPSVATATCLAPGDTGFIATIALEGGADVKTVRIQRIEAGKEFGDPPQFLIRPTGHSVTRGPMDLDVLVAVENQGTAPGWVGEASPFVMLAPDSSPLFAGFLWRDGDWDGRLEPGAEGAIRSNALYYPGSAALLWVSLDAEPTGGKEDSLAPAPPSRAAFSRPEEWLVEVCRWRLARSQAMEARHRDADQRE